MMKCVSDVYSVTLSPPEGALLVGTSAGLVVCVLSEKWVEQALEMLPPGLSVLDDSIGDLDFVDDVVSTIRIKGGIEVLVNKKSNEYQQSSVEKARQVLQTAVLLSGDNVWSTEKPLPPSSCVYQLAAVISQENGRAPVLISEEDCYSTYLNIDVIMLTEGGASPKQAILQQFDKLVSDVEKKALHFQPPGLGIPITILDSHNRNRILEIHNIFNIPMFSYFSPAQSLRTELADSEGRLISPHKSVPGVRQTDVFTVSGDYAYHHYMQDKFNDCGWGCAYRSLQTLVSWFLYNGYTTKEPPSHAQIQQTLVNMGDKPKQFLNSRQWIGSVEVGFVLDTFTGAEHRIQFVQSGEDMGMQGGMLSHHFRTNGTPVMIGGGVLAHTILGVKYDNVTGETQFLILDPHYTGLEDVTTVVKEGWCGWKTVNFWDKKAHYNMCMPQRPPLQ